MEELLQYVEAQNTRLNQKVRFVKTKSWWTIKDKCNGNDETPITVAKGKQTIRISNTYRLLQKPFDNL